MTPADPASAKARLFLTDRFFMRISVSVITMDWGAGFQFVPNGNLPNHSTLKIFEACGYLIFFAIYI